MNGAASCMTVAAGFDGAVMEGGRSPDPQECAGVETVRGTRPVPVVATRKSAEFESVSWQPSDFRMPPRLELRLVPLFTVVPPSPLLEAPQATRSTIRESGRAQGVKVAPQPSALPMFASATFPLAAPMLRLPDVRSAVKFAPSVPAPPSLTVRYLPAPIVVPAGIAKRPEAEDAN